MMYAKDFRREAREALSGHWGQAVGTGFVAALLGATTGGGSSFSSTISNNGETLNGIKANLYYNYNYDVANLIIGIFGFILVVFLILTLIQFFVSGAAALGYARYNLNLISKDKDSQFSDLFSMFHLFWKGFLLALLQSVFVFLWALLFIIPGIIAAYSYSMAFYIMCENPEMSAREALSASKELMKGYKFKYFCLEFSFIGWQILSVFTLGIGALWLLPYMEASFASFYRYICHESYGDSFREIPDTEAAGIENPIDSAYGTSTYNY